MYYVFQVLLCAFDFQQSDPNKPYWILRLVVEQNEAEALDVKKDTERADEIKAMKQAWEAAEPGRAVKVTKAYLILSSSEKQQGCKCQTKCQLPKGICQCRTHA